MINYDETIMNYMINYDALYETIGQTSIDDKHGKL
jgi:hypothetical protein